MLGFYFNLDTTRVVLIKKNRPDWQKGKLNGVGGKIETGESAYRAMIREFEEETGIADYCWKKAFNLIDTKNGWDVKIFFTISEKIDQIISKTDELLIICPCDYLPNDVIFNLRWMIPLLLDKNIDNNLTFILKE